MKRIIFLLALSVNIIACSDNKEKKTTDISTPTKSPVSTVEDKAVSDWLGGKEWKAESGAAPMDMIKLFSDGKVEFKEPAANDQWAYVGGEFGWYRNGNKMPVVTWPVQKVSDTTFSLFVAPTKKTYIYKFVRNL